MADLAPSLRPEDTVDRAVRTYLHRVERHPWLHHFLGAGPGSERDPGSPAASGLSTAIAVRISAVFGQALERIGADPAPAEPLTFGLVGLVDATVNRWLADPDRALTSAQPARFLRSSILHLAVGHLGEQGVRVSPSLLVRDLLGAG